MQYLYLVVLLSAVSSACAQGDYPTPYGEREDVAAYLDALAQEHDFPRAMLQQWLSTAQQRQDIIERISKPAETVWTWARYRGHLVDADRIEQGADFWLEHEDTLTRAAREFGVAPEYVVAILGIETRYGQVTGGYPVLDALATLGFDYAPRSKFFRKELTELLLLAREEGKDPRELTGSYAGAMGYGQFIPSSYRHYAVDFDADGVRDIWQNADDAIGSIANYFARHHWRGAGPVAIRVEPSLANAGALDDLAGTTLALDRTLGEIHALGIQVQGVDQDIDPQTKVAVYKLDGAQGDEYWLGFHDFYVITRYNRSYMYALAVHQLSQAIKRERDERVAQKS
jgi:membrane-bound lytic murein transglycosylase B